ncbi:MAG TPA: hypothetical protein VMS56_01585, partial [Thermoanaerobaculia bacterium]|nr:hypothetical protein [Thermoanaerobaculia bacterium]
MRSRSSVICAAIVAAAVLRAPLLGQGVPPSRIVPLGISPGPALEAMRQGLAPCAHAEQIGCRENFSPAAFRIEATMPAGMLTWFPGGAIPLAIESETAPGDPAPQTPEPLPRAHLRRFDEQGHPDPRAVSVRLTSELPPEALARNRHQIGANELVSPWIIALAAPRASIDYDWPAGLSKEALGCAWCERPLRLQGKEGVHEI